MLTEIVNFVATDIEDPFVKVCTCMYKYTHIFIVFPLFLVKIRMIFNCTLNGRIYIYLLLFNFVDDFLLLLVSILDLTFTTITIFFLPSISEFQLWT